MRNKGACEPTMQKYRSPANREGLKISSWAILSLRGSWVRIPPSAPYCTGYEPSPDPPAPCRCGSAKPYRIPGRLSTGFGTAGEPTCHASTGITCCLGPGAEASPGVRPRARMGEKTRSHIHATSGLVRNSPNRLDPSDTFNDPRSPARGNERTQQTGRILAVL